MKVEFHSGVADKLGVACRFLRKAQAAGATVVVCGDQGTLDRLDLALWTFDPLSFVAHARLKRGVAPPPALARTPIWLVDDAASIADARVAAESRPGDGRALGTVSRAWSRSCRRTRRCRRRPASVGAATCAWPGLDLVHHALGQQAHDDGAWRLADADRGHRDRSRCTGAGRGAGAAGARIAAARVPSRVQRRSPRPLR